jgi:hypothetical protein
MPRIDVPNIPDTLVNTLTTTESALCWIKRLEQAKKRLETELATITIALKYVVYPKLVKLEGEKIEKKKELEIESLRKIIGEREQRKEHE